MVDDVFMDEIIDSMEEQNCGEPKHKKCLICGESYLDTGEEGCCLID